VLRVAFSTGFLPHLAYAERGGAASLNPKIGWRVPPRDQTFAGVGGWGVVGVLGRRRVGRSCLIGSAGEYAQGDTYCTTSS